MTIEIETPYDHHLARFVEKMTAAGSPEPVIDMFRDCYRRIVSGETGRLAEADITPVKAEDIPDTGHLSSYEENGLKALEQTVMIKLNGGLGTSMGLTRPKSLIRIKKDLSFLDIMLGQAAHDRIALALMDSFHTRSEMTTALEQRPSQVRPYRFLQNMFPKIDRSDLSPVSRPDNPGLEWNPPGHGDVFLSLHTSGTLHKSIQAGRVYAFISNSDNLGAVMDPGLLGYFATEGLSFMMEVAERTQADQKGGHPARLPDGRLLLREIAQCPSDEHDCFKDIQRHPFFNTNNIWVNLPALARKMDKGRPLALPLILNRKNLDPRDENSRPVYQVETAMGAAISLFEGAAAVSVPRTRFIPVKTTADLLGVRSECFVLTEDFRVRPNPRAAACPPLIRLDERYYRQLDMFEERLPEIPDMTGCTALEVNGDVFFEPGIIFRGEVTITNTASEQKRLPGNRKYQGRVDL